MGRALAVKVTVETEAKVSILARPHGTGALNSAMWSIDQGMFQSSPVRMGRALAEGVSLANARHGFNPRPSAWDGRSLRS
mgnify:CR=1 FL=1